jgi:hypothetical protein
MVDLPAVNTPQFDWANNKLGYMAQPVPPIYQPEVPARAVYFGATNKRREIWVGWPTVQAIWANRIAPAFADRYLAKYGYTSQTTDRKLPPNYKGNLWEPVKGDYGAHGRFDAKSRSGSLEMFTDRHRDAVYAGVALLGGIAVLHQLAKKYKF